MTRRLHSPPAWAPGLLTGALLLSLASSAFAQIPLTGPLPPGLARIVPYTGLLTTDAYQPPMYPNNWITPNYWFDYQVPWMVYAPVAVPATPPQAAVQPFRVTAVTLRRGAAPVDVRVTPGTVVMWRNADKRACTLALAQATASGAEAGAASRTWQIRARSSVSLAFNQPGTYYYYRLQDPHHRARITVTR